MQFVTGGAFNGKSSWVRAYNQINEDNSSWISAYHSRSFTSKFGSFGQENVLL